MKNPKTWRLSTRAIRILLLVSNVTVVVGLARILAFVWLGWGSPGILTVVSVLAGVTCVFALPVRVPSSRPRNNTGGKP